jgi:hypothetical protein
MPGILDIFRKKEPAKLTPEQKAEIENDKLSQQELDVLDMFDEVITDDELAAAAREGEHTGAIVDHSGNMGTGAPPADFIAVPVLTGDWRLGRKKDPKPIAEQAVEKLIDILESKDK